ncbi:MAG: S8 family serine peptidase [Bdellovibrionota bacterium]
MMEKIKLIVLSFCTYLCFVSSIADAKSPDQERRSSSVTIPKIFRAGGKYQKEWVSHTVKQNKQYWHLKGADEGFLGGIDLHKAVREGLIGSPKKKIIVAVIDGGNNIEHEALKDYVFVNPGETGVDSSGRNRATNGKDDDGNGLVDDVSGWNFRGEVIGDSLEVSRIFYAGISDQYETKVGFPRETMTATEFFKQATYLYDSKILGLRYAASLLERAKSEINTDTKNDQFDHATLMTFIEKHPAAPLAKELKEFEALIYQFGDIDRKHGTLLFAKDYDNAGTGEGTIKVLHEKADALQETYAELYSKRNYKPGRQIGSPDVYYDPSHGTHVAGTIVKIFEDAFGKDVAPEFLRILPIRVVDGDERDENVAKGMKYAIDMGASIISMSFGKSFSPKKNLIDEVVEYGHKKGVIFVHAAGNESTELTAEHRTYPNGYDSLSGKDFPQWVEVGATGYMVGEHGQWKGSLGANFSNYGSLVDIMAPGVEIFASYSEGQEREGGVDRSADNTMYQFLQGTSMAAPVVSGVFAVMKSVYPDVDPTKLIEVAKKSSTVQFERHALDPDQLIMAYLEFSFDLETVLFSSGVYRSFYINDYDYGFSVTSFKNTSQSGIINIFDMANQLKRDVAQRH